MIKLKKILNELYSREYLEKIVNNIKNNIDIKHYLFDMDLPLGIYKRALLKCLDINIFNELSESPLHLACGYNNTLVVKLLLQRSLIDVNIKNEYDSTPLHYVCRYNRILVTKLLLEHPKLDANIKNKWGSTPLHYACLNNNILIVKLLLLYPKINVNIQNKWGETPDKVTKNKLVKELFKKYRLEHRK